MEGNCTSQALVMLYFCLAAVVCWGCPIISLTILGSSVVLKYEMLASDRHKDEKRMLGRAARWDSLTKAPKDSLVFT